MAVVVKVTDSCYDFEPSTTEDPPCRRAMLVTSVESSNVLPLCDVNIHSLTHLGLDPRRYGTALNVTNHQTRWAAIVLSHLMILVQNSNEST
ncbi:hypothetical protein TNCV_4404261 [Trichonephila clavipes]|uniref:Uncharacterized protein n=1 Tax=Trichonephila clavipes TaxID=2585209 RepID=A0A8X6S2P5_TRICX|nr:hypothetical protein TNCV_4404261 [Trichonephila clavipes]